MRPSVRRRTRGVAPTFDLQSLGAALAHPGMDPRTWASIGTVSTSEDEPVEFDVEHGQPYVQVTLQPSGSPVLCRVGGQVAGNGEAEWHPFVKGDEVLVVLPEGFEDSGGVIVSRLNNALDAFPTDSVAGQDPTTNTFAFRRRRAPVVEEFAGPITWRSALTGALIAIDDKGHVTIKDSENSALQMGADVIGFQGPSTTESPPNFLLQLDLTGEHFLVQVRDAILSLSSSRANPEQNTLSVPGALTIGTIGNPPLEHAASAEAVANVIEKVFAALITVINAIGPTPLTGTSLGGALATWLASPAFSAAWTTAASASLGSISASLPTVIAAAFAASLPKPQGVTQLQPSIGSPGLLIG